MIANTFHKLVSNASEMEDLGSALCHAILENKLIIYLSGSLGSGKTTWVRGFLRGMNFKGIVKSPTYTLVEPYEWMDRKVYHFDFYRLSSPCELDFMGIRDYFQGSALCLIEWPEKGQGVLPQADLNVQIDMLEDKRFVRINALSDRGKDALQNLKLP